MHSVIWYVLYPSNSRAALTDMVPVRPKPAPMTSNMLQEAEPNCWKRLDALKKVLDWQTDSQQGGERNYSQMTRWVRCQVVR
jgi:hypothetical protein